MDMERRTILGLVAMGRITPREAERLLAISSDRDEGTLRLAVGLAGAWVMLSHCEGALAQAAHWVWGLLRGSEAVIHRAVGMICGRG